MLFSAQIDLYSVLLSAETDVKTFFLGFDLTILPNCQKEPKFYTKTTERLLQKKTHFLLIFKIFRSTLSIFNILFCILCQYIQKLLRL